MAGSLILGNFTSLAATLKAHVLLGLASQLVQVRSIFYAEPICEDLVLEYPSHLPVHLGRFSHNSSFVPQSAFVFLSASRAPPSRVESIASRTRLSNASSASVLAIVWTAGQLRGVRSSSSLTSCHAEASGLPTELLQLAGDSADAARVRKGAGTDTTAQSTTARRSARAAHRHIFERVSASLATPATNTFRVWQGGRLRLSD